MFVRGEPTIVGIAGRARVGKDEAAKELVRYHRFVRVAFADSLKEAAAVLLNLPLARMYVGDRESPLPGFGFSIREFLQKLGTDCIRTSIDPDFWVKAAAARIEAKSVGILDPRFVVSDVRFQNEAEFIRRHGILIHVRRSGAPGVRGHESEAGVEPLPGEPVFDNEGTLDEFLDTIHGWAKGRWS